MNSQIENKFFYHIYPLGMCNARKENDFSSPKADYLLKLCGELDRISALGVNAIYIGPLFESSKHGYDTVDYWWVDRRLGNNEDFAFFVEQCHQKGISVVVDAVFNHTGRDFFAFKDIQQRGQTSQYKDWYLNLNFNGHSNYGDPFTYEGWAGCMDLIKLNVDNPDVQKHIFGAVEHWIKDFNIDGLRLDAADVLSQGFMSNLRSFCLNLKKDFWLMGEVVHGDYNNWVNGDRLHSVTNYQLYKGMWSSFNCANMFEVAWSLKEEFGDIGKYKNMMLYNFLDNHDVNRLASAVNKPQYLFPLYGLLFTVPGIPSIYYGSEKGICGKRGAYDDFQLRPALPPFVPEMPDFAKPLVDSSALEGAIKKFAEIRSKSNALKKGCYKELAVTNTSLVFEREFFGERVIIVINQSDNTQTVKMPRQSGNWTDLLNGQEYKNSLETVEVPGCWLRILKKN